MATAFNLTAQINLQGPANLKQTVSKIKKEFAGIDTNINVKIDKRAEKSVQNVTARLRTMSSVIAQVNKNTKDLNVSLSSLSSSLGTVKSVSNTASKGIDRIADSTSSVAKEVKVARTEIEEFGRQGALAIRRFAAFSVVSGAVFKLTNAITSSFDSFVKLDRQLIRLQQVTGKTASGLRGLEKEIESLSVSLGLGADTLAETAVTLAQAGLAADDARLALRALAKTELAPSFENIQKTAEGAIAAMRQFGIAASELEKVLGSINAVSAQFAVESGDIIAAIQRTGGVFASASKGVSEGTDALNEFIAVFTSIRATTRESAETIATGLRTILTRVQRASTIDQLRDYGIELQDAEGKFIGAYKAIEALSAGLSGLDPRSVRFGQIVEELGGFRQIGKVIPLIQQFAVAQEALKAAQQGQGSLATAQAKAQQSLFVQIAKVRQEFDALIRGIAKSTTFQSLLKIVLSLSSAFIKLAGVFKPILPILGILGAIKGVSAVGQFATGFFGGLKKGGGAQGAGAGLAGGITGTKEKEKADAVSRAADATRSNTEALKNLTTSVNNLTTKINSLGSSQKTSTILGPTGQPYRFASGGVVPGQGNRDTVPAMLTPGEFVIRKKAVETIGAGNLHKMNKYAEGGPILKENTVGLAILGRKGGGGASGLVNRNPIDPDYIIKQFPKNKQPDANETLSELNKEKKIPNYAVKAEVINATVRKELDKAIDTASVRAFNTMSTSLAKSFEGNASISGIEKIVGKNRQNFIKSLNQGVRGNLFEQIIAGIENKGQFKDDPDPQAPFDFIGPFTDPTLQAWFPNIANIKYKDGKATLKAATKQNIANKIGNEILIGSTPVRYTAIENKIRQLIEDNGGNVEGAFLKNKGLTGADLEDAVNSGKVVRTIGTRQKRFYSVAKAAGGFIQKFAEGGEPKKEKDFGQILLSGSPERIEARYNPNDTRTGSVNAKKWKDGIWTIGLSMASKGYGPRLYDTVMEAVTEKGGMLTSDRATVSGAARSVWDYYFRNRSDVSKTPLPRDAWTGNYEMIDEKLRGPEDTWPPKNDPAWALQTGYRKSPSLINDPNSVKRIKSSQSSAKTALDYFAARSLFADGGLIQKFAEGGSAEDTVPALLTPGEFVINKKAASRIGSANLNKMNKADKISGFNKGGPVGMVQRFAAGGGVQDVLAQQSGMSTSKFMKELGKELDSVALDIIKSLQQTKKSFVVSIGKATNAFAAGLDPAEVEASLQEAVAGLAEAGGISDTGVIQKAASDLFAGIQAGLPLDQIQAKSAELTQITARQITTTDALDRAMQRLSLETGIAADELNKIKDTQRLEAKQFFEGDIGKQFDGVITRTFPKTFKGLLDNSFGKLTANITKAFPATAITGSLVSLKGSLDYFGSDIQKLGVDLGLLPEDVKNSLSTLGGVLGGAGQGAAIGQALGGLLGPAGALGGAIVGAVAGGIKGYFDAQSRIEQERIRKESVKSQKRFEDNLARAQNEPLAEDRQEALERAMSELSARNRELAEQMGKLGGGTVYGGDQIRLPRTEEAATGLSDRIKKFGENMQRLGEMRLQTESADSLNERQDKIDEVLDSATTKTQHLFEVFGQTAEAQAALATLGANATEEQKAALLENLALSRYLAEQESLGVSARDALATWNANIADNLNATLRSTLIEKQAAIATQRAALAQENYNKQLESFTFKMDAVSQALNIFNNEMEFSLARLDNLNAGLAGEGPQGITLRNRTRDIIENPLAFSVEEFQQAAERVAGQGEAGQEISNLATASRIINQVLRPALSNTEDRDVSGVREAVQAQIDELFPGQGPGAGVPADLQQAIDEVLDQSIRGITEQATQRQGEGQDFANITDSVDQFSRGAAIAEETLKQLSEQREKEFQLFLDLEERRADAILKQVNITQQLVKTQADFNQQLRDAIGEFSSLEEMNAGFNAQIQQLTGGETDPTAISDNIIDLERQQREASDRINQLMRDPTNGEPDNRRAQEDLAREIINLQVEQKKYIQALELIANSNEKVSNAFKKLADEQKKAETGKDLLSILSSGSLEDILKLRTDIVGVQQALAGNTGFFAANPLASQLNPQILDLLQLSQEERRRAEGVAIQGGIGGRFGGAAAGMAGQFFAMMETGINNATQQVQAASAEQLRALIELRRIAELQENNVIKQQENIDILLRGLNDELGGGDANEAQEKFIKALEDLGINLPKDITNRVLEGLSLVKMGIQGILLGDDLRNGYLGIVENAYANITEKLNAIADRMNEAAPRANQPPNADSPPLGNPGNQAGGGRGGRGDDWLPDWLPDWWPVFDFRSRGGPIYAKNGMAVGPFKPRGKDTVPAMSTNGQPYMLQPGEFIVNKEAYQKNKGLVEAINGGMNVGGFGGTMYAAAGGIVQMGGIQVPQWYLDANAAMRQQAQAVAAYNQNYAMSGQYRRDAIANLGQGTNVDYAQRNSMAMADNMQRTAEGANTIAEAATSDGAQSGAQTGGMFGDIFGRMLGGKNPAAQIGGQIGGAMIGGIMGAFDNLAGGALSSIGQRVGSVFAGQTAEQPATPTPQPGQATPLPQPTPDVQAAPIDLGAVPSGPGGGAMSIPPEPTRRPRVIDGSRPTPETQPIPAPPPPQPVPEVSADRPRANQAPLAEEQPVPAPTAPGQNGFSGLGSDTARDAAIRAAKAAGRPLTGEEAAYYEQREAQRNEADPERAQRGAYARRRAADRATYEGQPKDRVNPDTPPSGRGQGVWDAYTRYVTSAGETNFVQPNEEGSQTAPLFDRQGYEAYLASRYGTQGTLGGASAHPRYEEDMATFDYYRQQRENEIAADKKPGKLFSSDMTVPEKIKATDAAGAREALKIQEARREASEKSLFGDAIQTDPQLTRAENIAQANTAIQDLQNRAPISDNLDDNEINKRKYTAGQARGYILDAKDNTGQFELKDAKFNGFDEDGNILLEKPSEYRDIDGKNTPVYTGDIKPVNPDKLDSLTLDRINRAQQKANDEYEKNVTLPAQEEKDRAIERARQREDFNRRAEARRTQKQKEKEEAATAQASIDTEYDRTERQLTDLANTERANAQRNEKQRDDQLLYRLGTGTLGGSEDTLRQASQASEEKVAKAEAALASLNQSRKTRERLKQKGLIFTGASDTEFDLTGTGVEPYTDIGTGDKPVQVYRSADGQIYSSKKEALEGLGYVSKRGYLTEEGKKFYTNRSIDQQVTANNTYKDLLGIDPNTGFLQEGQIAEIQRQNEGFMSGVEAGAGVVETGVETLAAVATLGGSAAVTTVGRSALSAGVRGAARTGLFAAGETAAISSVLEGEKVNAGRQTVGDAIGNVGTKAAFAGLTGGVGGGIGGVAARGAARKARLDKLLDERKTTQGVIDRITRSGTTFENTKFVNKDFNVFSPRQANNISQKATKRAAEKSGDINEIIDLRNNPRAAFELYDGATGEIPDIKIKKFKEASDIASTRQSRKSASQFDAQGGKAFATPDETASAAALKPSKATQTKIKQLEANRTQAEDLRRTFKVDSNPKSAAATKPKPATATKPKPAVASADQKTATQILSEEYTAPISNRQRRAEAFPGVAAPPPKPTVATPTPKPTVAAPKPKPTVATPEPIDPKKEFSTFMDEWNKERKIGTPFLNEKFDSWKYKPLAQTYDELIENMGGAKGLSSSKIEQLKELANADSSVIETADVAFRSWNPTIREARNAPSGFWDWSRGNDPKSLSRIIQDPDLKDYGNLRSKYNFIKEYNERIGRNQNKSGLIQGTATPTPTPKPQTAAVSQTPAMPIRPPKPNIQNDPIGYQDYMVGPYKGTPLEAEARQLFKKQTEAYNRLNASTTRDQARKQVNEQLKALRQLGQEQGIPGLSQGGPIYASKGMFVPKGPDTIPAMLAPNEFVVNGQSAINNLDLLKQINASRGPLYMNQGGIVSGSSPAQAENYYGTLGGNNQTNQMGNNFAGYVEQLQNFQFPTIPERIEMVGSHTVDVNVNGAGAFESLQGGIMNMINSEIGKTMDGLWNQSNGAVGRASR